MKLVRDLCIFIKAPAGETHLSTESVEASFLEIASSTHLVEDGLQNGAFLVCLSDSRQNNLDPALLRAGLCLGIKPCHSNPAKEIAKIGLRYSCSAFKESCSGCDDPVGEKHISSSHSAVAARRCLSTSRSHWRAGWTSADPGARASPGDARPSG